MRPGIFNSDPHQFFQQPIDLHFPGDGGRGFHDCLNIEVTGYGFGGGVGGCAGSSGLNPGAPTTLPSNDPWYPNPRDAEGTSASGRGGCGLVQIRYPV